MSIVEKAVSWAIQQYNSDLQLRHSKEEFGAILWLNRKSGQFLPGTNVFGTIDCVNIYTQNDNLKIMESLNGSVEQYIGDYHCHVRDGENWLAHFPATGDISTRSCLCDWLEFNGEWAGQGIPILIHLQLIQSLLFGDLFVVERAPARKTYQSILKQATDMKVIAQNYDNWHMEAGNRLGRCPLPISHVEFTELVKSELPTMNSVLAGRATIRLIGNTDFISDSSNFLL